jgi:hypothetical protein
MLVYQALASCAYWIGREVDDGIIDMAELRALVDAPQPGTRL